MRFSKGYDADKEKDTGLDKMSMEMESLFKLFLDNNNKFNPNKSFSALKNAIKCSIVFLSSSFKFSKPDKP